MLLSPIDHKHVKRDIKGDKIELCKDFANNINSSNYIFIFLARGRSMKSFTELFMVIFYHSVSQLEALHGDNNEKPKHLLEAPGGSESLIFTPCLNWPL